MKYLIAPFLLLFLASPLIAAEETAGAKNNLTIGPLSGVFTVRSGAPNCLVVEIAQDDFGEVTVDWTCINKTAARYQPKHFNNDLTTTVSYILKAIHEGRAKER